MHKYLIIPALILAFFVYSYVWAADTGAMLPTAAANDATVGTTDWGADVNTALTDNGSGPNCGCRLSGPVTDDTVRLFVGGVPVGDDKALGTTFTTGVRTYGGVADLWGLTPTPAQINAVNFGIGYSFLGNGGTSKYLYLSDFDFAIPADATIDGIKVDTDVINSGNPIIDYVTITVYYTEAASSVAATGAIRTSSVQVRSGSIQMR